jgi:hypothetical protein
MMKKDRSLGLDELMIVNPGEPVTGVGRCLSQLFLGEDGALYEVQGLDGAGPDFAGSEFFLGDNGALYQVVGRWKAGLRLGRDQFFLGDDGGLYRVVNRPLGPSFRR